MGVNWDSRSLEFRLLFIRYNKQLHYQINNNYMVNRYVNTLAMALNNKAIDQLKDHQSQLTKMVDDMMYGVPKKKNVIDNMAAKVDFLKSMVNKQFKSID